MINGINSGVFKGKPVRWLPCFAEPAMPLVRNRTSRPEDGLRIAFFGRLAANKGLDLLILALAERADLNVICDIWGEGPEAARLQVLATINAPNAVLFKGRYPSGFQGAELMCGYDAIVMPSTGSEGLPLVLLEAMTYGVPCLVTKVGAMADCCDGNPDFVLMEPTVEGIFKGLAEFERRLILGSIDQDRLCEYYNRNYSEQVMKERWAKFLKTVKERA